MLVIFPFEAPFYRARGVNAEFVGHPLATLPLPTISREDYAAEHGLDPQTTWIALLPGSREKEVLANLPTMLKVEHHLDLLWCPYEFILPMASTLSRELVQDIVNKWEDPHQFAKVHLVPDAREALHHARAAIVASGTATVQALTIGTPFVVVYRVSPLTFAIVKRLVRYPVEIPAQPDADGNLPIAMPNLIAGRRIVPELLNDRFTAENLAAALEPLLAATPARAQMIADLAEARAKLLPNPDSNPIHRVCDAAEDLLRRNVGTHVSRTMPTNV
jgi:lipid-A-disaccharide synthase